MSLSEDEKYAIMANVPYQIHEGVPIHLIEEELKLYGLDHEIDKELSDRVGVILHNDDEMIHAVRGTDFTSTKDLISDLGLILGNPTFIKGINSLALAEAIPTVLHSGFLGIPQKNKFPDTKGLNPDYLDDVRGFTDRGSFLNERYTKVKSRDTAQHLQEIVRRTSRKQPQHIQARLEGSVRRIVEKQTQQTKELGKGLIGAEVASKSLKIIGESIPEYLRIGPERNRLDKALEKYPNKTPSLTGHSLGSVVNVLGRELGIKTISFNPAPQGSDDGGVEHHPDSKVYRIKGDIVSYKGFRTREDTEPITEFEPRYGSSFLDYHRVGQFIPEKPKISIGNVMYSPFNYRPISYDNKRVSQAFDYCKEYPYLPECSGRREKAYY